MANSIFNALEEAHRISSNLKAKEILGSLIQSDQYVGEVYSMSYEHALVQIHDRHRMDVGGIPSLSFLIATRLKPEDRIVYEQEDSSILLLRVLDAANLPNASEADRIRAQAAQRASGEDKHWDEPGLMDGYTANLLSFAGIRCRIIGTFFLDLGPSGSGDDLVLSFGSDISNYYPNRGLKVYKPVGEALRKIVNFQKRNEDDPYSIHSVRVGEVRYASSHRPFQGIHGVPISICPADLRGQKTALFGMTRTGKSNTTKILAKSVFELRFNQVRPLRVGQIIFDPNGEYANENVQDADGRGNPSAMKNVWKVNPAGDSGDIVTFGLNPHPNDPDRRIMKLNFYHDDNLQEGKNIIDHWLQTYSDKYITNFRNVIFDSPPTSDRSATTRFNRRVLAYRTLLNKANFSPPGALRPRTTGLFNRDLLSAMQSYNGDAQKRVDYNNAAQVFATQTPSWSQLESAFQALSQFMKENDYTNFENLYVQNSSTGDRWADDSLKTILTMFEFPNGSRLVGGANIYHSSFTTADYTDDIFNELLSGKLVIIDQALGDPEVNKISAERVLWRIFRGNLMTFSQGNQPQPIIIYLEEAHNLLPKGSEEDTSNVWARTAKEGAKLNLGMVYATQEVSSIQRNILKNTANWFVGHLNCSEETKELAKYYDFRDFENSILRAQDKGFIRVKTLSNPFIVPSQIDKFEINLT